MTEPTTQRIAGRAWVFGDDVDTDVLAPGRYMKLGIAALAAHCLEDLDPAFASGVRAGDVVVGGRNFGAGSSREQAPAALRELGVTAVLARSFAGLFYRNALNLGLPVLKCADVGHIASGHQLAVDIDAGQVQNMTTGEMHACEAIPEHLRAMVRAGGLLPYLEQRLAAERCATEAKSP